MRSLIKIAFNNIKNNKFKYTIISIVFMLSILSGVFALTFSDLALKTREDQLRKNTLNTQLSIITKDEKDIYFESENILEKVKNIDGIDSISPRIGGQALCNDDLISFVGIDIEKQINVYDFEYEDKLDNISDSDSILVSSSFIEKYSKNIGDNVTLNINEKDYVFKITGILKKQGDFQSIEEVFISLDKAQEALSEEGKVYSLGVTLTDLSKIDNVFNALTNSVDDKLIVDKKYDINDYKSFIDIISVAMRIFTVFSIIISILLCYSTYKSLIYDRVKLIGTYRSLGISKLGIYISMFFELIMIVIPSVILGEIVSNILMRFIISSMFNYNIAFQVDFRKSLTVILVVILSGFLSMCIAVREIFRKNVVSLIKGNMEVKENEESKTKYFLSALLFLLSMIFYNKVYYENNQVLDIVSMILIAISFSVMGIFIITAILKIIGIVLENINTKFKSIFKEVQSMINQMKYSIILIVFIIAIASVSNMISQVINNNSLNVYKGIDIVFNNLDSYKDQEVEEKLEHIGSIYRTVSINRHSQNIDGKQMILSGIDTDKYLSVSFEKYLDISKDEMMDNLKKEKDGVILNKTYAKLINKDRGDKITINTLKGDKDYTIVGIVESFEDKGSVIFFSKENFNTNFVSDYTSYLLCVEDESSVNDAAEELRDSVKDLVRYNISTLKEMQTQNEADNSMIFMLINIVIFMSLAVSVVCLINNLIVNLIKRKSIYAIKRTLGMELSTIKRIIFLEGFVIALGSSVLGIILGTILNKSILNILSYYIGGVEITNTIIPVVYVIAAIVIVMIVSIYPYRMIKKADLVEIVKGSE